jgi:DNA-binding transcriptional LysR family regulator
LARDQSKIIVGVMLLTQKTIYCRCNSMDIRLFKTFLLVAELLNITKAAEQLSFSKPAITAQIYSLEDAFRVKLFERNGKRLVLEHRYDFGFIHGENTFKQIRKYGIWTEDVLWVASPDLLKHHEGIKGIKDFPIINYTEGSVFRTKLDEFTGKKELQSPIEYSDSEAINHAVMAGLGISYLPRTLVKDEIANCMQRIVVSRKKRTKSIS